MTKGTDEGEAPAEVVASAGANNESSGSGEGPLVPIEDFVKWKQTNLEEYYEQHIDTMDKAIALGRQLKEIGERCEIAIGQLGNHVEKADGGRGLEGGIRKFSRGIELPESTVRGWMIATATEKLRARARSLGTKKVELIERSDNPPVIWKWHDEQVEEAEADEKKKEPTVREIKAKIREVHFKTIIRPAQAEGEYNVIAIDPPWQYDIGFDDRHAKAAIPTYPTMNIEELEELHIPAAKDCALFMWVTNQFIHEGLHLLEHWGFDYKGIITWVKDKAGTGRWFLNQTEHVLLGIKGGPLWTQKPTSNIIHAKRRQHSRKPDEFYSLVEQIAKHDKRIDMFSCEPREGWVQWGAEVEKFGVSNTEEDK